MTSPRVVADVCGPPDVILADSARPGEARQALRQGGIGLLGDPARGQLAGIIPFGQLARLSDEAVLAEAAEPAALVPGSLLLDRAFHILLTHPEVRWLVTEAGNLVARERLVPPALEPYSQGGRPDSSGGGPDSYGGGPGRQGLSGDPVAPASELRYRCPAEPDEHIFKSTQIEAWTTDLKARCPVDGKLMTAFLPSDLE